MLWHSIQGAGGTIGGGGTQAFTANYTDSVSGVTSITLPSSGIVGDLAIISHTALYSQSLAVPTGWTKVSETLLTGSFRQFQRVIYKVIEAADLGGTLTLQGGSVVSTYGQIEMTTFTPTAPINTVVISSLDEDFSTSAGTALPTRVKDTATYDPPNIVFAVCSTYNTTVSAVFSDETFFDSVYVDNDTAISLMVAYEIQGDANTSRTLDPVFGGSSAICHSFVLNVT